jgi:hypothetical protein
MKHKGGKMSFRLSLKWFGILATLMGGVVLLWALVGARLLG